MSTYIAFDLAVRMSFLLPNEAYLYFHNMRLLPTVKACLAAWHEPDAGW